MDILLSVTIETRFRSIIIPLNNIPYLDIGDKEGETNYIDFLKWEDVEYPIMKGIDKYNRPFIVIKSILNDTLYMETYFKRHNTEYSSWQCCGNHTYQLLETTGGMNAEQGLYIKSLVENGEVVLKEEHMSYKPYIGKTLRVYDEKKWKAAEVIQNQFRKCRYDPNYQMCKNIQMKNMEDIYRENNRELVE